MYVVFCFERLRALIKVIREMYHPLLIAVISLIGATCASNIADGLDDDQNEIQLQSHQELTQGKIPTECCFSIVSRCMSP